MINRVPAGILALGFILFIARRAAGSGRQLPRRVGTAALLAIALAVPVPHQARAADAFADGAIVRVQSNAIEYGWFTGHIRRDQNKCWMVHLDRATKDHYTMLALLVIDELEVAHGTQWTPVAVKPLLQASPALCREYGAD